jgi:hypothetical protein
MAASLPKLYTIEFISAILVAKKLVLLSILDLFYVVGSYIAPRLD